MAKIIDTAPAPPAVELTLEEQLAAEKAAHLDTQAVNQQLSERIEELEGAKAPAATTAPVKVIAKVPTESFKAKVDGAKIEFVFTIPAFRHNGALITAEQALTDQALLQELADMGFGGIKRAGDK